MVLTIENSMCNPFYSFLKDKKTIPSAVPRFFEKEHRIAGKKVIISQTSTEELSDLIAEDILQVVRKNLNDSAIQRFNK
jgi:hypothetical protein